MKYSQLLVHEILQKTAGPVAKSVRAQLADRSYVAPGMEFRPTAKDYFSGIGAHNAEDVSKYLREFKKMTPMDPAIGASRMENPNLDAVEERWRKQVDALPNRVYAKPIATESVRGDPLYEQFTRKPEAPTTVASLDIEKSRPRRSPFKMEQGPITEMLAARKQPAAAPMPGTSGLNYRPTIAAVKTPAPRMAAPAAKSGLFLKLMRGLLKRV